MSRTLESLRALVVEDDRIMRSVIASVIRGIGVGHTLQADNGEQALDLFKNAVPAIDFVVCDWAMPKLTGIEFLKTLRETGYATPFLMLTAHIDAESIVQAKQAGVTSYIVKPFTPQQIERKVHSMLQALLQ